MSLDLKQSTPNTWALQGSLNVNTITAIMKPGYRMIDALPQGQVLTVDLAGVDQADSASIALLIDWLRYAKKNEKSIKFSGMPSKMRDIIKVSNLEGIIL